MRGKPCLLLVLLVLVATLGLVAAGSGGDDDDSSATPAPADTAEATDSRGSTASVPLSADPDGALAYDTTTLEATASEIATVHGPSQRGRRRRRARAGAGRSRHR